MHRRLLLGWCALALLAACSNSERPARLGDAVPDEPEPTDSFVDDADEAAHPNLQSPCGATTVALEFLRPNLYFAIDASGSMLDAIPLGQALEPDPDLLLPPTNRYGALALAIQTVLERVGHRVNYGASLFPSNDTVCDGGDEILELTQGDTVSFALSGEPGPLLDGLMFAIYRRTPRGGTPIAGALRRVLPRLRDLPTRSYVFLLTDGGPNCSSLTACGPERCIPNLENAQLSETLSCTAPLNCCDAQYFGPDNCLDDGGSLAAVRDLADAGIGTFVIGIPGSEVYADLLSQLAVAGGTARGGDTDYYGVANADELVATVSQLGLDVALSCHIQLADPPLDRDLVNLFFDGQLVPSDPQDGWAWLDDRTVELRGEACELLETGQVLQADVIAGCPVIIR